MPDRLPNNPYYAETHDVENQPPELVGKMALALQGSLLIKLVNADIAEAFCRSRLSADYSAWVYGTLPRGINCQSIIEQATPQERV